MSNSGKEITVSEISPKEAFYLWVMRRNEKEKTDRVKRAITIGRLTIDYERRRKTEFWGRFGGGWNWNLGFQASGRTIIFNLLISSVRFHLAEKEKEKEE